MHLLPSTLLLASLTAPLLVAAIAITSPAANTTITAGTTVPLSWTSVDTDPSTFSIELVNFVTFPPSYSILYQNIVTALGNYSVYVPCATPAMAGYQVNAINGTNVFVIYAQSPAFSIAKASSCCVDPPGSVPTSTCAAPTVTVTVAATCSATGVVQPDPEDECEA
ncbi:hypothetical protein MMC19_004563 [Ptychographa xylographoides]|nr:hypothetical protein [Ptychographa xylographoides]